jgi:hypothetical protein
MSVIQIARSCELLSSIDLTGIAGLQVLSLSLSLSLSHTHTHTGCMY